jgi:hypothetical protein
MKKKAYVLHWQYETMKRIASRIHLLKFHDIYDSCDVFIVAQYITQKNGLQVVTFMLEVSHPRQQSVRSYWCLSLRST